MTVRMFVEKIVRTEQAESTDEVTHLSPYIDPARVDEPGYLDSVPRVFVQLHNAADYAVGAILDVAFTEVP